MEFAIVNRVNQPLDGCTRVSSIITLIVVTPIIRGGMCVRAYTREIVYTCTFDNDNRLSRSSDPMLAGVSLDERKHDLVSGCFEIRIGWIVRKILPAPGKNLFSIEINDDV